MTNTANTTARRYIDTAEQAKMIRKSLKEAFPTTKISVRTSRYAGGSSINVRWFDGPTEAQVESVIGRFRSGGFNGMTDTSFRIGRYLEAEEVQFGASFLFTERRYTREFVEKYAPRAAAKTGVDLNGAEPNGSDEFGWHAPRLNDWADGERFSREFVKYTEVTVQDSRTARRVGTAAI